MNFYQIKVTLMDVRPPIWRSVQVPGTIALSQLHRVLQIVMGWGDCHLHRFAIDRRRTRRESGQFDSQVLDEKSLSLGAVVELQQSKFLYYEYDFGDGWVHELAVEEASPQIGVQSRLCIGGSRRCPPEDCGGPGRYQELLAILQDPRHRDHEGRLEWAGGAFDPEVFDLESVNKKLRRLRVKA